MVFAQVEKLYQASERPMGLWMWNNHVQWVAGKAFTLAEKYGADMEKVYCAALLHDLADCRYERDYEGFEIWSDNQSSVILKEAGFTDEEVNEIVKIIIQPHSCRSGNLPTTIEGKVLATADAMFHLQTSFFPMLCFKQRPENTPTYEKWQEWFREKIARDYGPKIFFEDERLEVKSDYDALLRVFGNNTLDSKEG